MKKTLLSAFILVTLNIIVAAASPAPDSIGVRKVQGKNYILHEIESAEGWFSIARKYGISYAELRMANKDSADKLVPGSTILVPVAKLNASDPFFDKNYIHSDDELFYNVKEGETLFSIAKRFYTNVDSLKKWNRISVADLKAGQRLKVGYKSRLDGKEPDSVEVSIVKPPIEPRRDSTETKKKIKEVSDTKPVKPVVAKPDSSKPVKKETVHAKTVTTAIPVAADSTKIIKTASSPKQETKKSTSVNTAKGRKEVYENGVASWIRDDDINPNKYYALHRSAPIGTIIKVTNKMNNKYVFVKVVGSLPDTGDNTDLVIKISKASAEKLGVRDSRFQCELNYGVNEKQ